MKALVSICVWLALVIACEGRTITVDDDGPADFNNIQAAIDAAYDGDTVIVADGTYTGPGNRDIDFLGKAITVKSQSGPNNCIIDSQGTWQEQHRGFYFHGGEEANSVVDGFTIRNGYTAFGGGILCEHSSPTFTNCIFNGSSFTAIYCGYSSTTIINCTMTENMGSAIYSLNSNLTVTNCLINNNTGCDEGAIFGSDCNVTITDCTITGNASVGIGCHRCTGTISLSTITDNHGDDQGGIFCADCNLVITDCTISGNSGEGGGGIGCWSSYYSVLTVRDCNITSNIARGGGAVYYEGPVDAEITDCKITGNQAEDGGAILCYKASPTIRNCEISENIAKIIDCSGSDPRGGAIYCHDSSPEIINCIISGNTADEGGGIYCLDSSVRMGMCTISDNCSLAEGDPPGPIRGGGGVYCEDASLTITDSTMADNTADGNFSGGGAILCRGSTQLEITDCTIRGNSAKIRGGGICCDEETVATITGCRIIGNSSEGSGGGILCMPIWDKQTKINNCLITGNAAEDAGGIAYYGNERPDITNCTIANNIARDGYGGGIVIANVCQPGLDNCILFGNSAEDGEQIALVGGCPCSRWCSLTANHCDIEGGPEAVYTSGYGHWELDWDNGNIDTDPLFIEPGYWDVNGVWVDGDYRLLAGSPCIDSGDPNYVAGPNETDLEGNPRVIDGDEDGVAVVDMGAYEYRPAVEAGVEIKPETVNLGSRGKWIRCYIRLGEEYDVGEIEPESVLLEYEVQAASVRIDQQRQVAVARFRRAEARGVLEAGEVEVTVSGELTDGTVFEGADVIRVIDGKGKKKAGLDVVMLRRGG